jgi:uncharacterized membrane protein YedE/YeeE
MSYGGTADASSLHFFDPFGTGENAVHDWSMLILFCAALIPTFVYWQLFGRRTKPWFDTEWHIPTNKVVDRRLVLGSLIFGAGWALGGFCPGPSIAGLVTGHPNFVAFSYGMYAYYLGRHLWNTRAADTKRHLGLTLVLGTVPAALFFIGPAVFPLGGAPRPSAWPVVLSVVGGLGIGLASIMMYQFNGRVLGLCGLWKTVLDVKVSAESRLPQLLFFVAFMAGGAVTYLVAPEAFALPPHTGRHLGWIFLGGLLTGLGTDWANGCTSGHGIAGFSRLSIRSVVAVPVFMAGVFLFLPAFNVLLGD